MLSRCVFAELRKLSRSPIWLMLFIFPAISMLFGAGNYWMNQQVLTKEWYSLWTQVVLFYCYFFFPVFIAICCSYLCRLEWSNHNWNLLLSSPVSVRGIIFAKLIVLSLLALLTQAIMFLLYYAAGLLFQFSSGLPAELAGWFIRGWCASVVIGTLQLYVSLCTRSFALPVGFSVCACILGLGAYTKGLGLYFPYSMLSVGMGSVSQSGIATRDAAVFYTMCALFLLLFCGFAINLIKRRDVKE